MASFLVFEKTSFAVQFEIFMKFFRLNEELSRIAPIA